jgi:O-antigen/teichoic acid export membrane protein
MSQLPSRFQINPVIKVILSVTSFLLGTNIITSILGFFYWIIAARTFMPADVGFGSATISAIQLLGAISIMGVGTILIIEMPRHPRILGPMIVTGLVTVTIIAVILGLIGAIILPHISRDLGGISTTIASFTLFVIGVSLSAIAPLVDQIFIGLLRSHMQLLRNTIFAVVKLLAIIASGFGAIHKNGSLILLSWVFGIIISLIAIFLSDSLSGKITRIYQPNWQLVKGLARPALGHHLLNMELLIPNLGMPIIVASVLSTADTAYFSSALNISSFILYLPFALAITLFAVGSSGKQEDIAYKVRFTLMVALATGAIANLFLFIGAGPILSIFGRDYQEHSTWCLRVLGLSVFPLIIKDQYIAVCRIRGKIGNVTRGMVVGTILELVCALVGGHNGGLLGLSIGWNIALCLEALVMAPAFLKMISIQSLTVETEESAIAVLASASLSGIFFGNLETLPRNAITGKLIESYTAQATIPRLQAVATKRRG